MAMFTSVSKIAPMFGMAWSLDILTGHKPFPTFNKERKGEGFKEVFDKAMEEKPWEKESAKNALTKSLNR